jgi:hypothetical protein
MQGSDYQLHPYDFVAFVSISVINASSSQKLTLAEYCGLGAYIFMNALGYQFTHSQN